jgi:hypothetical protein
MLVFVLHPWDHIAAFGRFHHVLRLRRRTEWYGRGNKSTYAEIAFVRFCTSLRFILSYVSSCFCERRVM